MFQNLKQRLPDASDAELNALVAIIDLFNLEPTVDNFDSHGFLFRDSKQRSVRVRIGTLRKGSEIWIENPYSDIVIVFVEGMMLGWCNTSRLEDLEDRMSTSSKSLNPMPNDFNFAEPCAHLTVHGGISEGSAWICLGCGRKLIFNEAKK